MKVKKMFFIDIFILQIIYIASNFFISQINLINIKYTNTQCYDII